ncbi:MAG: molybdopterin molybdotransferase MoeA, partial [Acetatifactor sp.]|nr:molybdopterin molybdotransferase MoeA [Acetatifactor sp.]
MAQDKQESLLEIEDCLAMLLERVSLQEVQEVSLAQACGMVLAETVCSDIDVPPYQKSAMDGYAVCAADLESISEARPAAEDSFVELKVKGRLFAGDYEEIPYEKHTAVRVMTGAFVPEGYDAVVRQEDTDYGEETVKVFASVKPYQNYCKAGEDIRRGDVVAERGTRLTPVHIGLLAETGRANIRVYRPVRVAILCTGSELARVGEPLGKGKIYNNISYICLVYTTPRPRDGR